MVQSAPMTPRFFQNRRDAGRQLAARLKNFVDRNDVQVLALPRGGVPVGFEVARVLEAPLDVFVVRKLGVPGHEELGMGAIASGGVRVVDEQLIELFGLSEADLAEVTARERMELKRRETLYRGNRPPPEIRGKTVMLVDDGLATGATMKAAIAALRQQEPRSVIVAVPVAALETCEDLRTIADDVICAFMPEPFVAVGRWYRDFSQTSDEEVRSLLKTQDDDSRPKAASEGMT
jgi:predicted phosphoribosyltransferase